MNKKTKKAFAALDLLYVSILLSLIGTLFLHTVHITTSIELSEIKEEVALQAVSNYILIEDKCSSSGPVELQTESINLNTTSSGEIKYSCEKKGNILLHIDVEVCSTDSSVCSKREGYVYHIPIIT